MTGSLQGRTAQSPPEDSCEDMWVDPAQLFSGDEHSDRLFRTVETEIIPRLVMLHRQSEPLPSAHGHRPVALGTAQVEEFTSLILKGHDGALAYLKDLAIRGVRVDTLCLDLLGPCARRLGELWNADLCDFTEVTIGLGRLQALLRSLSVSMSRTPMGGAEGPSVLFAFVPGEQHTFGLAMVCDFFRSSGWAVWGDSPGTEREVLNLVREHAFDVVGFAIGNDRSIEILATLIRSVRKASKNRDVRVLVGGPLLMHCPQIATLVGADATASDARQAILAAQRLVARRDEGR